MDNWLFLESTHCFSIAGQVNGDRPLEEQTNGWTEGWVIGWKARQTGGKADVWTNIYSN